MSPAPVQAHCLRLELSERRRRHESGTSSKLGTLGTPDCGGRRSPRDARILVSLQSTRHTKRECVPQKQTLSLSAPILRSVLTSQNPCSIGLGSYIWTTRHRSSGRHPETSVRGILRFACLRAPRLQSRFAHKRVRDLGRASALRALLALRAGRARGRAAEAGLPLLHAGTARKSRLGGSGALIAAAGQPPPPKGPRAV